jgi:hypothetical protein
MSSKKSSLAMMQAEHSGSSSSSSDSEERRRHEKKERKRKRSEKHEKKEKKEKKESKHKRSEKEKKEKKEKKRKRDKQDQPSRTMTGAAMTWGARGIIRESDLSVKQEEFLAWLAEHKGINQEALRPWELKEHFATYVEDFNTATLPHDKYYNMATWYASDMAEKARADAKAAAAQTDRTDFDDEGALHKERQRQNQRKNAAVAQVMASAMAAAGSESSLVADMRQQEAAKLELRAQYAVGDIDKARARSLKMDPKYVSPEELKAVFGGGGGGGGGKKHKPQKQ